MTERLPAKPPEVFDRDREWEGLCRFATKDVASMKIGIVRGRRRVGKSFLLRRINERLNGFYTQGLRGGKLTGMNGLEGMLVRNYHREFGPFTNWPDALNISVDAILEEGGREGRPPLLIVDEFPYWVEKSPELPSIVQLLYDERTDTSPGIHPPFKLILSGSALSLMSKLLAGNQALFGRATMDLRIGPLRFRDSARFWGADTDTAFLIDAVLGGAPGYRALVDEEVPEPTPDGLFAWLSRSFLEPQHQLFIEADYLLAEDPWVRDHGLYFAVWDAVSRGATTPAKIGALLNLKAQDLTPLLNVMRDAEFVQEEQNILWRSRPVITMADPAVRFHNLIVRPNTDRLEEGRSREVWADSQATFSSKILGPHFERMAREWVLRYGNRDPLPDIGHVGETVVSCPQHNQSHQVDVVALDRESTPRTNMCRIVLLGEAKHTNEPRKLSDLARLEHIRDVLVAKGYDATQAQFAIFSRTGFDDELAKAGIAGKVHLLDLPTMYGS